MRRPRALLAHEPDHVLAVQLHGEARTELARHHDRGIGDLLPQLVRAPMHEVLEHPDRHAREVGEPVFHARVASGGPRVAHF